MLDDRAPEQAGDGNADDVVDVADDGAAVERAPAKRRPAVLDVWQMLALASTVAQFVSLFVVGVTAVAVVVAILAAVLGVVFLVVAVRRSGQRYGVPAPVWAGVAVTFAVLVAASGVTGYLIGADHGSAAPPYDGTAGGGEQILSSGGAGSAGFIVLSVNAVGNHDCHGGGGRCGFVRFDLTEGAKSDSSFDFSDPAVSPVYLVDAAGGTHTTLEADGGPLCSTRFDGITNGRQLMLCFNEPFRGGYQKLSFGIRSRGGNLLAVSGMPPTF